jgi:hypothetical protein
MKRCPDCNWDGATPAMVGKQAAEPGDPNADAEGLITCKTCKGEGLIPD